MGLLGKENKSDSLSFNLKSLKDITDEYIASEYPDLDFCLSPTDVKLINIKHRLNKSYAEEFKNRKHVVLLEPQKPLEKIEIKTEEIKCEPCCKVIRTCPAFKLNNEVCGAKLKGDAKYCGRHSKKYSD